MKGRRRILSQSLVASNAGVVETQWDGFFTCPPVYPCWVRIRHDLAVWIQVSSNRGSPQVVIPLMENTIYLETGFFRMTGCGANAQFTVTLDLVEEDQHRE